MVTQCCLGNQEHLPCSLALVVNYYTLGYITISSQKSSCHIQIEGEEKCRNEKPL